MTGKRFTYEYDEYNGNLFDNKYKSVFYPIEDSEENIKLLCERLNELHGENQFFEKKVADLIQEKTRLTDTCNSLAETIEMLQKENQNLNGRIQEYEEIISSRMSEKSINEICNFLKGLHEENKELKQLNIPVNKIKDTVVDCQGRIIGVYYND